MKRGSMKQCLESVKKGKSSVLTDTPVKTEIEQLARLREEKKNKKKISKSKKPRTITWTHL